jgi:hypothetical protein
LATALSHERFALEHTFNAWSTTARPAALVAFQHAVKELTFHRSELLDERFTLRYFTPKVNLRRSVIDVPAGSSLVHFGSGDRPLDPDTQCLEDSHGHASHSRTRSERLATVRVSPTMQPVAGRHVSQSMTHAQPTPYGE